MLHLLSCQSLEPQSPGTSVSEKLTLNSFLGKWSPEKTTPREGARIYGRKPLLQNKSAVPLEQEGVVEGLKATYQRPRKESHDMQGPN